ncbi:MAG: hypothetical protein ABW250_10555, partial [Pyrinomonadaceae bacterium]
MKKLFYSAAVALALCVPDARASLPQSRNVRVGPAAEEAAPDATHAPPPKKDEKKSGPPKTQESAKRPEPTPLSNSTAAAS